MIAAGYRAIDGMRREELRVWASASRRTTPDEVPRAFCVPD
jgi:hypothetical protein